MAKLIVDNSNIHDLSDEELTTGIETDNVEIAGITGFFSILWKLIQLAFANKGKLRTRIDALEANEAKMQAAINKLEQGAGVNVTDFTPAVQSENPSLDQAVQKNSNSEAPKEEKPEAEQKEEVVAIDPDKTAHVAGLELRIAQLEKENSDLKNQTEQK